LNQVHTSPQTPPIDRGGSSYSRKMANHFDQSTALNPSTRS
jgi:hypothetical protein